MIIKLTKQLLLGLSVCISSATLAAPVIEGSDYLWETTDSTVSLEVLSIDGAINAGGDLSFGRALPDGSGYISIFDDFIAVGDATTYTGGSIGFQFLWALANTGTTFDGSYTLFSDSTLNPNGWDAMLATAVSTNVWDIEFEDYYLPIAGPGTGDITVRVTNFRPVGFTAVPAPTTLALMAVGLLGLGLKRRRTL